MAVVPATLVDGALASQGIVAFALRAGSVGDAGDDRPGLMDPAGRAKHDAWA
jgi:acyl-CoA-binding protein